jgi:hypothetical protein
LYGVFTITYLIQNVFIQYTIYNIAAELSLHYIPHMMLFPMKNALYLHISIFPSTCTVPSMVVSCSSLTHHLLTQSPSATCSYFQYFLLFGIWSVLLLFNFQSLLSDLPDPHANKPSSPTSCLPLDTACTSQKTHSVSIIRGEGIVHPRTGHEGPEGNERNLGARLGMGGQHHTPANLPPCIPHRKQSHPGPYLTMVTTA